MNKLRRSLDDLNDRAFVWSVMSYKAEMFYSRLKLCFKFPIIVVSSAMSIINSNFTDDNNTLKIINICFNVLTAMLLSIGATLQIEQKEQEFKNNKNKFLKIVGVIEQKLITDDDIDAIFINTLVEQYNNIEGNIDFEIPSFICKSVRNEYGTHKTLPLIINGIKKMETERSKSITMDENDYLKINRLDSVLTYNSKTPRVLDVVKVNEFGRLQSV